MIFGVETIRVNLEEYNMNFEKEIIKLFFEKCPYNPSPTKNVYYFDYKNYLYNYYMNSNSYIHELRHIIKMKNFYVDEFILLVPSSHSKLNSNLIEYQTGIKWFKSNYLKSHIILIGKTDSIVAVKNKQTKMGALSIIDDNFENSFMIISTKTKKEDRIDKLNRIMSKY
jgi:hypothetical protein